jgi:CBS domain-containing protein
MSMIETDNRPLGAVLRQITALYPGDSVHRAVEMLRYSGADTLPVVDGYGGLAGVISMADLRSLALQSADSVMLLEPVAAYVRQPSVVGRASMSVAEVRATLAESDEATLFILDDRDYYVGAVTLADLLVPMSAPQRPIHVGGMATPWGVYLTSGTIQAGVGNGALLGGGVLLGAVLVAAYALVQLLCYGLERQFGTPLYALWNSEAPARLTTQTAGWFILQGLPLPVFLLLMRLLPLSGYHAAEHQAVHAIERGEPLHPAILRRMPRVHPRCGTNIMAGALIFTVVSQALPALHIGLGASDSAVLGALVALFTWRSLGAFLQQYFTTRPATDKQLESGIRAAEDLEQRFASSIPHRPTLARRLWCMGMPQMVVGTTVGATVTAFLLSYFIPIIK